MSFPNTVLVAGGTGNLGNSVVDALLAKNPTVKIRVLGRHYSEELVRKGNGRISFVVGDLVNSDLSEAVKGVDAVVSCIIGDRSVTVEGQKRLIDASKAAGTVKQFIPSAFSFDYRQAKLGDHPYWDDRKAVDDYLKQSGIPYTIINQGMFMETALIPNYMGLIDMAERKIMYWGDNPDTKIEMTTYSDTGKIVAAALYDPWALNRYVGIHGDEVSPREICDMLKELTGHATLVRLGSFDDLNARIQELLGKGQFMTALPLLYTRGLFYKTPAEDADRNRAPYKDIKFTTFREALAGALSNLKEWAKPPKTMLILSESSSASA